MDSIKIFVTQVQQLMVKDYSSKLPDIQWGLEATVETFYSFIPDAPGVGIKSPASEEWKLFIQSTSQGARCLKKGRVVLYMCGEHDTKKDGAPVNVEPEEDNACEGKVGVIWSIIQNESAMSLYHRNNGEFPVYCTKYHTTADATYKWTKKSLRDKI